MLPMMIHNQSDDSRLLSKFAGGWVAPSSSAPAWLACFNRKYLTSPHRSTKLLHIISPHHLNTREAIDAMAPRKKTEEKASANEAADMVLHYLRKSLTSDASRKRD